MSDNGRQMNEMNINDNRITVRLLDPVLEAALVRFCAQKRRKKPDVMRNALVNLLEAEGYLAEPAPLEVVSTKESAV